MAFISRYCLLIFFSTLFLVPVSIVEAQSNSIPILVSRHKFSSKKAAIDTKTGLVVLTQGVQQIKKRPADYAFRQNTPNALRKKISAKSAVVMDDRTGRILYSHALDVAGQPASTIKVLTGLISIDSLKKNESVPVSRRAARMPRSKVYLRPGKAYPANDLIDAVLLASANDASVALAEKIAGSEKVFSKLMTAKAKSFGARNTICKTASGLTAKGQKSTARDLAKIFRMAMRNPEFARKMNRTKIRTSAGKLIRSHNKALWQVDGAKGGKTGYTNLARQTYVGKFSRPSGTLIVALMGSETMWDDVKNLVEHGFVKKRYQAAMAAVPQVEKSQSATTTTKLVQLENSRSGNPFILTGLSKRPSKSALLMSSR